MPTVFLETVLASATRASLSDVTAPVYVSADFVSDSMANAAGLGSLVVFRADLLSPTQLTARIAGTPTLSAVITAESLIVIGLPASERVGPEFASTLVSESVVVVPGLVLGLPTVAITAESRLMANFLPDLPDIREPEWYELRGTVNLVRNASVEHADVGLLDWAATGGASIAVDGTTAWHGLRSVEVTYPGSGSNAAVSVRSEHGLGLTGGFATAMVGSVSLLGTLTQLKLRLTATYSDATTDQIDGDLFDLATAADDWYRAVSPSLPLNPAKMLDSLALEVIHPTAGSVTVIHADGAQIEQDRGETATPFAQGDMGEHYAWLGPEGFSMSLRETAGMEV